MTDLNDIFSSYLAKIFEKARSNVREESYYSVLEDLLNEFSIKTKRDTKIDSFPKQTEAGNPDIRILNSDGKLIGYIEAKDPKQESLETIEDLEQLDRYRKTFPNLILTNFCEFRLYRNGALLGKPVKISDIKTFIGRSFENIPAQNLDQITQLFEQFFSFLTPRIYTPKALAIEMAKKTRFLRDEIIQQELMREINEENKPLLGFYQAFKEYLISSLTKEDFANLYAQTIAYGLFIARHRYEMKPNLFEENSRKENILFTRDQAYKFIQPSLGILRELFKFISSEEPSSQLRVMVDDIADLLAAADLEKVVRSFYKDNGGRDPIIHFYETFLAEYDPKEREKRGVYYTPEPVVSYIVRSVHSLLKEKFGKEDGLATSSVTVLDPAAGTLTFPAKAITLAVEEYKKKYGTGGLKGFIKEHILEDFYAFELMMAPYAIGHLKIDFILDLLGYKLGDDERFKYYLTNTLEMEDLAQTEIPTVTHLAKESQLAGKVKREIPILVVIGNPPYSGVSENNGEWILQQIEEYKKIEGEPLREKNSKWIQDDYVKFFRFAQWKIEQTGYGILGFITNHAWLDNPTFRGMRYSLLKTFNEIYILNLHGRSRPKELIPSGVTIDENVFDIQRGVSISIFMKNKNLNISRIHYADLWGPRGTVTENNTKYYYLENNDLNSTKWDSVSPKAPYYLFTPLTEKYLEEYNHFVKITDIFPLNGVGMTTARDSFVIDLDKNILLSRIRQFKSSKYSEDELHQFFNIKKKKGWSIKKAWNMIQNLTDADLETYTLPVLYRLFDSRWIFYHDSLVWRTVKNIMKHLNKPNLALLTKRQSKLDFTYAFVTNQITEGCVFESAYANNSIFPLYIYRDKIAQETIFTGQEKLNIEGVQHTLRANRDKEANISQMLIGKLTKSFSVIPTPEEIFYYIYSVLYSGIYRKQYKEFLKIDFPRIPFTKDYDLFKVLSDLGKQLVDLHLLNSPELDYPISKFYGKDNDYVEKPEYKVGEDRIYINNHQYFDGVKPEVWNYYIGGYQVLNKWLKDRKGKILSSDDIKHYCRMVTTLSKTIEIQKEIDKLYPEVEKNL